MLCPYTTVLNHLALDLCPNTQVYIDLLTIEGDRWVSSVGVAMPISPSHDKALTDLEGARSVKERS